MAEVELALIVTLKGLPREEFEGLVRDLEQKGWKVVSKEADKAIFRALLEKEEKEG